MGCFCTLDYITDKPQERRNTCQALTGPRGANREGMLPTSADPFSANLALLPTGEQVHAEQFSSPKHWKISISI